MQSGNRRAGLRQDAGGGQKKVKGALEEAMAALRADDVESAELLLGELLETHRQVPQVYLGLARCDMSRGEYASAMERVQTALSLKDDLASAYNLRGEIQLALEDKDRALPDFQKAVELKPSLVKAHLNLAQIYLENEQEDLARAHCETALEYEPHKDSIRLLLCNIHEQSGDMVAAQEEALAAVCANPDNVAAYLKQGMISFKQRDLLQAEKSFEGLLEVKPDSMMGFYLLGLSALGLEKYQLAERSLKKAQELVDDNAQVDREWSERIRQQLVRTYLKQGKHEQALVAAKKLAKESRNKRILKTLADIYYEMGQFELACQQYRAIVLNASRLSKKSPELLELLQRTGEPKETADAWRAAFSQLRERMGAEEDETN